MEQLKNKMLDKAKEYSLKLEDTASILGIHVDAVRTLVEMKLLPCIYSNPRHEWRFRENDIRFLLLK